MKRTHKPNSFKWAALLAATIATAACSSGEQSQASQDDPGDSTQAPGLGPAELVFYTSNGDSEENFNRLYGDSLRKKFPQFTIKYILSGAQGQSLDTLLASKTRFDVFIQGPGFYESQAFPAGLQFDMSELMRKHNVDIGRLDKASVDYVKESSGNGIYFLPVQLEGMALFYNKSLFDKFGIAYPTNNMTWEQMWDKAKQLTRKEGDVQFFGFGTNTSTIQGMNPLSIPLADLATDTPTINTDERWKSFFDAFYGKAMAVPGYQEAAKAINGFPTLGMFVNDQIVGMYAYQSGVINVWEEQLKKLDWDLVALPPLPGQPGIGSMATPKLFGITSIAKDKDAAMAAIQYLLSDEHQIELARQGMIPIVTSDTVTKELGKLSVYKDRNWGALVQYDFAKIALRPNYYSRLNSIYQKHFKDAFLGLTDLNTALRAAEEESVKSIQDFKSK